MKKKKLGSIFFGGAFFLLLSAALVFFYSPPPLSPPLKVEVRETKSISFDFAPAETFRFDNDASLAKWERKVFKGETNYKIQADGAEHYLRASSLDSSCGLFMKTNHAATSDLFIRWKWRARTFPSKKEPKKLASRSEDDFAARIYVIFLASNLFRSDVIEYIWDESLPVGESTESAYSDRIKLMVVRSGPAPPDGGWQEETRNPLEDYIRLFGKPPKHPIGIVAVMCDSDNTGSRAEADFAEIAFGLGQRNSTLGRAEQ